MKKALAIILAIMIVTTPIAVFANNESNTRIYNSSDISSSDYIVRLFENVQTYYYYGNPVEPSIQILSAGGGYYSVERDKDYTLTYYNNNGIGVGSVVVTGKRGFSGSVTLRYNIVQPTLDVRDGIYSYTFYTFTDKLKKKKSYDISAWTYPSSVRYTKVSGNKKIKVSPNGIVTAPKGLKKGKYVITVRIDAVGNNIYKGTSITKKITIRVKKTKVYWTRFGRVYHLDRDCPGLNLARSIKSGYKSKCPKRRACKICG